MPDYNYKLLDHFMKPRNIGVLENPDGYARVENPINGYTTDIYIQVVDGCIKDIKFKTKGCTVTIASASALTDIVKGKAISEFFDDTDKDNLLRLIEEINLVLGGVPEKNWHCIPTAVHALIAAIYDYYSKNKFEENIVIIEKTLEKINNYFEQKIKQLDY